LRRAVEVWRTVLGSQHPTYATGLVAIAELLSETHTSRPGRSSWRRWVYLSHSSVPSTLTRRTPCFSIPGT
jgi:hypothetical protein